MKPHLQAWKVDAEHFGLTFEEQKGLMFLQAFSFVLQPISENESVMLEAMKNLSDHTPGVPDNYGENYDGGPIIQMFVETATKLEIPFEPRMVPTSSGDLIPSFSRRFTERLPNIDLQKFNSHAQSEYAKVLIGEIGNCIEDDLEGALLSGIRFYSSFGRIDVSGTGQLGGAALSVLPYHMQWLHFFPYDRLDNIAYLMDFQKVATMATRDWPELFYNIVVLMASLMIADRVGERLPFPWPGQWLTLSLDELLELLIKQARRVCYGGDRIESLLPQCRRELQEMGAPPRHHLVPMQDAVKNLKDGLTILHGFDITKTVKDVRLGEWMDMIATATNEIIYRTVINKDWVVIPA